MTKRTSDALALIVASLVLFNAYRLAPLLPNDTLKGILVLVCALAGTVCLVIGAIRLVRDGR
jgi:MFS superfamily sulfate permease-like transporter